MILLKSKQTITAISFKVEAFELVELAEILYLREALEMQEQFLVQLRCPVVLSPFNSEKISEIPVREKWMAIFVSVRLLILRASSLVAWIGWSVALPEAAS